MTDRSFLSKWTDVINQTPKSEATSMTAPDLSTEGLAETVRRLDELTRAMLDANLEMALPARAIKGLTAKRKELLAQMTDMVTALAARLAEVERELRDKNETIAVLDGGFDKAVKLAEAASELAQESLDDTTARLAAAEEREKNDEMFAVGDGLFFRMNPGGRFHGWLFRQHPDGFYVSVRKCSVVPRAALAQQGGGPVKGAGRLGDPTEGPHDDDTQLYGRRPGHD